MIERQATSTSDTKETKLGQSQSMATSFFQKKPVVDPYKLDFKQLKTEYMDKTTKKVQFAKSSFLHYCKNNYVYAEDFGGRDTVITMELVQEPCDLTYKQMKVQLKSQQGTKCDKGDKLLFRQTVRERAPYYGSPTAACRICYKEIICYRGYYCCVNADENCDYDVCQDCYRGKKVFKAGITCPAGDPLSLRTWSHYGAQCNICEVDISVEDGFYQCHKNCSYEVCPECFKGEKIAVEGKTCGTGEILQLRDEPRARAPFNGAKTTPCSLCQKEISCQDGYFVCCKADEDCDDSYCRDCWQDARGPATCDEGHKLEPVDESDRNSPCDICGESINPSEEYFRCVQRCNYDVCPNCMQNDKYLIMEEMGVHEDNVNSKTAGAPFGEVKREFITADNLEDCIADLNELATELFKSPENQPIDLGFTVQASSHLGAEAEAVGYIFYKTDEKEEQKDERKLGCVIKQHSADKTWEDCMAWLRVEIQQAGKRYFKHCYSPVAGDSEEKITAVWFWEHKAEDEEYRLNFEFVEEFDWEALCDAAKDFAAKQYNKTKIIDVQVGIQEGDEGMYATFVTVDDPKATGGFIFGFEQFNGNYEDALGQMAEKFKTCSQTYFVGTSLCYGDNADFSEKTTIMALYDPKGESIEPDFIAEEDRPYTGDMFTCDKKRRPINYSVKPRECIGEKRSKSDTVDHVVISNWNIGGMHLHFSRFSNVTIPYPPIETNDRFYFSHTCDAIYWLTKIDAQTQAVVVLQLNTFKYYLHELKDVPILKNLENSSLICQNHLLVFNSTKGKKGTKRLSGDYYFYDLFTKKTVWFAQEIERVFFSGNNRDKDEMPDENDKKYSGVQCAWVNEEKKNDPKEKDKRDFGQKCADGSVKLPEKMLTLRLVVREKGDGKDSKKKAAKKKKELVYTFRELKFEEGAFKEEKETHWQQIEPTELEVYPEAEPVKNILSPKAQGLGVLNMKDIMKAGVASKTQGKGAAPQITVQETPEVMYCHDYTLEEFVMIFKGNDGDQHRILQFIDDSENPKIRPARNSTKPGTVKLSLTQNCFLKDRWAMFLIQTLPSGRVEAQAIDAITPRQGNKLKDPTIIMENTDPDYELDVWYGKTGGRSIQSLSKSKTDDFLNAYCINTSKWDNNMDIKQEDVLRLARQHQTKVRCQEIQVAYPIICSNIGAYRISIQSIVRPNEHYSLQLADEEEFLCWSDFHDPQWIGLRDSRNETQKANIPFEQTGTIIAFLTRATNRCEKKKACKTGDMIVNLLKIDPFAEPMSVTLFSTNFEACMMDGARDDFIYKSFVFDCTSLRGNTDVTLCNQYNDSIVFDCITSTKQNPVRFPYKLRTKNQGEDEEEDFEPLEICKGFRPVPVPMMMDKFGNIYFIVTDAQGAVKIYRVNDEAVMGSAEFFEEVYSFQSKWVYFFTYLPEFNRFYIMDDTKRIRVLAQDQQTWGFSLLTTMSLCQSDKEDFDRTPFYEYTTSPGMIHYNNKIYTMIDNKNRDNPTWHSLDIMLPSYEYIAGPANISNSDMIYYIQYFKDTEEVFEIPKQKGTFWAKPEPVKNPNFYGKHCIVIQPMADSNFLDCLPQPRYSEPDEGSFFSFISPDHVMALYNGQYLVFTKQGNYRGRVEFKMPSELILSSLHLRCCCDQKKFFVFEGPVIEKQKPKGETKEQADKKKKKQTTKKSGPASTAYYVFELVNNEKSWFNQSTTEVKNIPVYRMELREMNVKPQANEKLKEQTTISISPAGVFDQVTILRVTNEKQKSEDDETEIVFTVQITSATARVPATGLGSLVAGVVLDKAGVGVTKKELTFSFDRKNYDEQKRNLNKQITPLQAVKADKKKKLTAQQEELLTRLMKRQKSMCMCWKIGAHVIAKCGSEVKYINFSHDEQQSEQSEAQKFSFNISPSVWVQSVFSTSVEGILQLFLIEDDKMRLFLITWNMEANREQSMFQSRYKPGVFPENTILHGLGSQQSKNFNFCIEEGVIIDLFANLPCQFFDKERETDLMPRGALKEGIPGQSKISDCGQVYLDQQRIGHMQHFISLMDLVYWERFDENRQAHELGKGKVTSFSPVTRFPNQLSVFHNYATDQMVLDAYTNVFWNEMTTKKDDKRAKNYPLLFLHRHPAKNKQGQRVTPLQVTLEKQSPQSFEIMLDLLTNQNGLCVTTHLLGKIKEIIDNNSTAVITLFDECFRITDQLVGPRPLQWTGSAEELYVAVSTAYLEDQDLQEYVNRAFKEDGEQAEEEEEEEEEEPQKLPMQSGVHQYNAALDEAQLPDDEETEASKLKQVEAKLLDFDWVFTGNNAKNLIAILAETTNDEIFACQQIRVFIEFMWKPFFNEICWKLFVPYLGFMFTFIIYASILCYEPWTDGITLYNFLKLCCYAVFFPLYVKFVKNEIEEFRADPQDYLKFNFWDCVDLLSLFSMGTFMVLDIFTSLSRETLNVSAAFAVLLLWGKLFYWLRLFKPFSAFIRMITEIVKDIRVFAMMLFIVFIAFGNCIIILNYNRSADDGNELYSSYIGNPMVDSLINAYLIGLGDFNYDSYNQGSNVYFMWFFFLGATFIVQLVFMNMLIALMGESFGRISGLLEQATMKELCVMINDNNHLINIGERFSTSRYILWLTPGMNKAPGSAVERSIGQLRDYVEDRQETSDNMMLRQIGMVDEQLKEIKLQLEAQDEDRNNDDDESDDDNKPDAFDDKNLPGIEGKITAMDRRFTAKIDRLTDIVEKLAKGQGQQDSFEPQPERKRRDTKLADEKREGFEPQQPERQRRPTKVLDDNRPMAPQRTNFGAGFFFAESQDEKPNPASARKSMVSTSQSPVKIDRQSSKTKLEESSSFVPSMLSTLLRRQTLSPATDQKDNSDDDENIDDN